MDNGEYELARETRSCLNAAGVFGTNAVAVSPTSGTQMDITFPGLVGTNVVQLWYASNNLTPATNITPSTLQEGSWNTNGTNEAERIVFNGSPTGGTFTLAVTLPGGTTVNTGPITYSTTAATTATNIQNALNAATAFTGGVAVTGTSATLMTIDFNGTQLAGWNITPLAQNTNSLLPATATLSFGTTTNGSAGQMGTLNTTDTLTTNGGVERDRLTMSAGLPTSGTMTFTYGGLNNSSNATGNASTATTLANTQGALDNLFGAGNTRIVPATTANAFEIYYGNALAGANLLNPTVSAASRPQPGPAASRTQSRSARTALGRSRSNCSLRLRSIPPSPLRLPGRRLLRLPTPRRRPTCERIFRTL